MKGVIFAIALLGLIGAATANCPNQCSGHGTCGCDDLCTCYPNWQGLDCSSRTCPYGRAWVDSPTADNDAHDYAECSGRGLCDRRSGVCDCFDGFSGEGCRRLTCPNDCSGHGVCQSIKELATNQWGLNGGEQNRIYNLWDADQAYGCQCDPTYSGADCSLRECPKGDDPLVKIDSGNAAQVDEVQVIHVWKHTDADFGQRSDGTGVGYFTLTYTDMFGARWTTRPIGKDGTGVPTAATVEDELEKLPNHAMQDVTVAFAQVTSAAGSATGGIGNVGVWDEQYTVTFEQAGHLTGDHRMLECNYGGCTTAGCQPYYTGLGPINEGAFCYVSQTTAGTFEKVECSNRGNCDTSTGLCNCFEGYTDEDCSTQTVLI